MVSLVNIWVNIAFDVVGIISFLIALAQLAIIRRSHILEVYRQAFSTFDTPEMRQARDYVYKRMGMRAFAEEGWLEGVVRDGDVPDDHWKDHRRNAEIVARSFDQLGLLVREGLLPLSILARFYATPALKCWCRLHVYVDAQRRSRPQPGHLWEWENLVYEIIIPRLRGNRGTWKGVSEHDQLERWIKEALECRTHIYRDSEYRPRERTWDGDRWWRFWRS
jgi:hypothetical protein